MRIEIKKEVVGKKVISLMLIVIIMAIPFIAPLSADRSTQNMDKYGSHAWVVGWNQSGGKWCYMFSNGSWAKGWNKIGNYWYYFDNAGWMLKGWQQISGYWYYLNTSTNVPKTGPEGAMATGWIQPASAWYYLRTAANTPTSGPSGSMISNQGVVINATYRYFTSSGTCENPHDNGWRIPAIWSNGTTFITSTANLNSTYRAYARNAISNWNSALSYCGSSSRFVESTTSTSGAYGVVNYYQSDYGNTSWAGINEAQSMSYSGDRITNGYTRIKINTRHTDSCSTAQRNCVVSHELGHSLMLSDMKTNRLLMYEAISTIQSPTTGDRDMLNSRY